MSAKFAEKAHYGLVSIVLTRSTHGHTEPQQHYYIPTAAQLMASYMSDTKVTLFSIADKLCKHKTFSQILTDEG